jgi:hypothetical protein
VIPPRGGSATGGLVLHRSLFLALCLVAALAMSGRADEFVLGGAGHRWADQGAASLGVIDFVARLDSVRDDTGATVFAGADPHTDWIMPLRLRPAMNISRAVIERGGTVATNLPSDQVPQAQLLGMLDGDHTVALDRKFIAGQVVQNNGVAISLDLGARFGVNRIVFYPRKTSEFPFASNYLRAFELYVNDGLPRSLYASGQPIFTSPIVRRPGNSESTVVAAIEPQYVRFLKLKSITTVGFEVDEVEVYGTGFVPEATYQSRVVDLGAPRVWGGFHCTTALAGDSTDSQVEIRMRSGSDPTPDVYYRTLLVGTRVVGRTPLDAHGDTLSKASYDAMVKSGGRGEVEGDAVHWGQWQVVTDGQLLDLPAPRRYVQLKATFTNLSLQSSRALGEVRFAHGAPLVDDLVAEIAPSVAAAGQPTTFTYVVRVANASGREGFTRLMVETPSRILAVRSLEVLDADLQRVDGADFGAAGDLARLPVAVGEFAVESADDRQFTVVLPRVRLDRARVRVVFDAIAFRYGTRFRGWALAAVAGEPDQSAVGGDASAELSTDDVLVRISGGRDILAGLEVSPAVCTPNGDGANDTVTLVCTLLHLLQASPLEVSVFDLSGRCVRHLPLPPALSGRVAVQWDGCDDNGGRVPPGVYLVRAEIRADTRSERRFGRVAVAY